MLSGKSYIEAVSIAKEHIGYFIKTICIERDE